MICGCDSLGGDLGTVEVPATGAVWTAFHDRRALALPYPGMSPGTRHDDRCRSPRSICPHEPQPTQAADWWHLPTRTPSQENRTTGQAVSPSPLAHGTLARVRFTHINQPPFPPIPSPKPHAYQLTTLQSRQSPEARWMWIGRHRIGALLVDCGERPAVCGR